MYFPFSLKIPTVSRLSKDWWLHDNQTHKPLLSQASYVLRVMPLGPRHFPKLPPSIPHICQQKRTKESDLFSFERFLRNTTQHFTCILLDKTCSHGHAQLLGQTTKQRSIPQNKHIMNVRGSSSRCLPQRETVIIQIFFSSCNQCKMRFTGGKKIKLVTVNLYLQHLFLHLYTDSANIFEYLKYPT